MIFTCFYHYPLALGLHNIDQKESKDLVDVQSRTFWHWNITTWKVVTSLLIHLCFSKPSSPWLIVVMFMQYSLWKWHICKFSVSSRSPSTPRWRQHACFWRNTIRVARATWHVVVIHIINRALMFVCMSVLISKRYGLSVTQKIPISICLSVTQKYLDRCYSTICAMTCCPLWGAQRPPHPPAPAYYFRFCEDKTNLLLLV
jgi:hypothetical protein